MFQLGLLSQKTTIYPAFPPCLFGGVSQSYLVCCLNSQFVDYEFFSVDNSSM